jgi:zinc protease
VSAEGGAPVGGATPAPGATAVPAQMHRAPAVGPLPRLEPTRPVRFVLSNGLEVIAVRRDVAPLVAVNLMFRVGSDGDPALQLGLGSSTADMLDEGAGARDPLKMAEDLEQLGADLWLGCGRDGSQLSLQVPLGGFEDALGIAADVLLRPRLAADDWERVRGDRLTSLSQRRDQPEAVASLAADRVLFGDEHPYGRPAEGYEATVGRIGIEDIRRFHATYYRPNNASLVVAGAFADDATLARQLEAALGAWAPGAFPAPLAASPLPPRARLVLIDRPAAPQSIVRLVGPGLARTSPDRPALSMLNAILGGSFTSRLNFNLREQKGYTYGAGSSFGFYRRAGSFTARAAVFTEVTAPAVAEFLREIAAIREAPVTPTELTKARATLLGRVAEGLSTSGGIAAQYAELRLYGLPLDEPARFVAALERAGVAELQQLAQRHLDPDRMAIVVVGDRAVIEKPLRALRLGEVRIVTTDEIFGPVAYLAPSQASRSASSSASAGQ